MKRRISYDHPFPGQRVEYWDGNELLWVEYVPDPLIDDQRPPSRRKGNFHTWVHRILQVLELQK